MFVFRGSLENLFGGVVVSVLCIFSGHCCSSWLCVLELWLFANFEESTFVYFRIWVLVCCCLDFFHFLFQCDVCNNICVICLAGRTTTEKTAIHLGLDSRC